MFSNAFQSGTHVEVFDSKVNKEKNEFYLQLYRPSPANGVKRDFDKQVKGYLLELEGQTTKLIFPKDQHKELCLVQQYLVLQVYIPHGFPWSLELTLTDTTKTKRRVNLSTAISKSEIKYFHVKQPIDHRVKRNMWLNLAIDCYSFMAAWKGQTYRSLDQITLGAYCKLRRIFTMRDKLIEFSNDDEAFEPSQIQGGVFVPKGCQLNPDVLQSTQVIVYEPPLEQEKVKDAGNSLAHSSVRTTKKQPNINAVQEKRTIPNRLYVMEPTVTKSPKPQHMSVMGSNRPSRDTPSEQSANSALVKSALSTANNLEKHHHTIPQHKEDEQSDELHDYQKQLKKQLQRLEKKDKFEPIGRTKKVFLSDAEQVPLSGHNNREIQPAKIELVRVRDHDQQSKYHKQPSEVPLTPQDTLKESSSYGNLEESEYNYEDEGFEDSLEKEEVQKIHEQLEQVRAGAQKLQHLFPTSTITKKNSETVVVEVKGGPNIELIYDEVLDCYYDPKSNIYYTIN